MSGGPGTVAAGATALAVTLSALAWQGGYEYEVVALHQVGVARDAEGALAPISESRWASGALDWAGPSRVLPPEASGDGTRRALGWGLAASRSALDWAWLRAGTVPGARTAYGPMAERALLDLRTLTAPTGAAPGAVLAGPSANWRYVWPRDAAFVAVAYARTGHQEDALEVLRFLQAHQGQGGILHARYLPDGSRGVPDERGPQEDGQGWVLWATAEVVAAEPDPAVRRSIALELSPLITASTRRLLDRVDPRTGLPRPSADYWEVPEDELTLGIAATSLVGLESAAWIAGEALPPEQVWRRAGIEAPALSARARAVRAEVVQAFGLDYPRHAGGRPDAAVTFLLPPFTTCPLPGAAAARIAAVPVMRRPAGGMAPGAGWKTDGISWTPETALQALAAAAGGREEEAREWLDWLDAHRTEAGSLPEKVLHDDSPAAVAPLAWTSALVLITLDELEHGTAGRGRRAACG